MARGFLQDIFNDISLQRDQSLWLSDDDSLNPERLQLLSEFSQTRFVEQLARESPLSKICAKNDKISVALREKASLSYAQGDCDTALQLYNQSLQFCPLGGPEACAIFAGRSAIWVDWSQWDEAIADIDRALQQIVSDQRYGLLERKAHCLAALGDVDQASKTVDEAVEALKDSGLKANRLKAKTEMLQRLKRNIQTSEKKKIKVLPDRTTLPTLSSPHPGFPSFDGGIRVKYESGRGRYCVAERDFVPGDLLAVETPFVWMVDRDDVRRLCWQCFNPVKAPLACDRCSGVVFCGSQCKDEAAPVHAFECGVTEAIYQANIGAWALALKALIKHPPSFYLEHKSLFESSDETSGAKRADIDIYSSDNIFSFHNLVTHSGIDQNTKQAPELMMQALVAIFLLRCLQRTGYLAGESSGKGGGLSEQELFFALLLHHFMRAAYFNTHEIAHLNSDNQSVRIGRATNPSLALINHSCDPNYRRVNVGRHTLAFAIRPIKGGEEITDAYCTTFAALSREGRMRALEKYNFVCCCPCCTNDWPKMAGLPKDISGLSKELVGKIRALDQQCSRLKQQKPSDKLLEKQRSLVLLLRSCLKGPHQKLVATEDSMYRSLLVRYATRSVGT